MFGHRPHPSVAAAVRRVAGFAEHSGAAQLRRELPHAGVTLILSLGDQIRISSAGGCGEYTSFLAGLHEIPVSTEHAGTYRCLQVDLTPLGAYRLLGMPMSELVDTVVGLDLLNQPGWRELSERLAEATTWSDRFRLVDHTLGNWLAEGPEEDPEVGWAWRQLTSSHGNSPIGQLAAEVGWSRRHFAARFQRQVGLTPKATGQVLRFSHALSLLTAPHTGSIGTSISTVAAEAGYADQSHLNREFRRLTGSTPSQLLRELNG